MPKYWRQPAVWAAAAGVGVGVAAAASLFAYRSLQQATQARDEAPVTSACISHSDDVLNSLCMHTDQLNAGCSSEPVLLSSSPLPPPTPAAMQPAKPAARTAISTVRQAAAAGTATSEAPEGVLAVTAAATSAAAMEPADSSAAAEPAAAVEPKATHEQSDRSDAPEASGSHAQQHTSPLLRPQQQQLVEAEAAAQPVTELPQAELQEPQQQEEARWQQKPQAPISSLDGHQQQQEVVAFHHAQAVQQQPQALPLQQERQALPQQQQPQLSDQRRHSMQLEQRPQRLQQQQKQAVEPQWPRAGDLGPRLSVDFTDSVLQSGQAGDRAMRQHRSFNTARHAPSLDTTVASAAVARSLEVQYKLSTSAGGSAQADAEPGAAGRHEGSAAAGSGSAVGAGTSSSAVEEQQGSEEAASLAASCAALCVQHCTKLQDAVGRETTVLDIGCGTGGCCFELAASFSHVLGIDGDLLNITAAKELKAQGELCFRPVAAAADTQQQQEQVQEQPVCVVRVPDEIDRDRVRFWHCPLPQLPPKLQPVDAVLVEDVDGHLGEGLEAVCQQLPALLSPEGVCVVVLDAGGASCGGRITSLDDVRTWLSESRLEFVREVELCYDSGSSAQQQAHAGVWLQR